MINDSSPTPVTFPEASYEIPLEIRLKSATTDFSHPRLGIHSTGHHTMPITTAEAKQLLTLLKSSSRFTVTNKSKAPVAMNENTKMISDDFSQSFDASVWAKAFVAHVAANPSIATDEGTMLGWFANAIMRGHDGAISRSEESAREMTPDALELNAVYSKAAGTTVHRSPEGHRCHFYGLLAVYNSASNPKQ